MADASLNRCMTVRPGDAVTFAQIGVVGLDGQIELEALRLYGLPEGAPALLCGTPTLPVGQHEFAAEVALDLPSLAPGCRAPGRRHRRGRPAGRPRRGLARLLDALHRARRRCWSNNTVRVLARNISGSAFDLGAATLSLAATKRRMP